MMNTEMVIFSANGDTSSVGNYYSKTEEKPNPYTTVDSCYTTTIDTASVSGYVIFNTTRPLDCNIADTYVVQLDTTLELCTAWNPSDPNLSFHQNNYFGFSQTLNSDGTCVSSLGDHDAQYLTHGIFMWFSWAVIGLSQIFTNRYLRHKWRWSKITHSILGFFSAALIITAGLIALKMSGWTVSFNGSLHSILGFFTFILGLLLIIGGMTANIVRLKVNMAWNTKRVLLFGKIHKWFGRLLILGSQFVICTGFYNFYSFKDMDTVGYALGATSCGLFIIGLVAGECFH